MRKLFVILIALLICMSATAFAEEPSCVMLRFSNDTRYKNVDSASVLSDLVIEKLLAIGKFNFSETRPIDENIESKLYDVKSRELANAAQSMYSGNLNALFEGPGFNETQAQTIATADVGQIITPSITSSIGTQNRAEYLIQGNVINLGNGAWVDANVSNASALSSVLAGVAFDRKEAGIGVQTDLRIIKASTGEVIWRKIVTGKKTTALTSVGVLKFGTAKLSADTYNQAMEDAAQKITDALIADLDAGKLFAR